MKKFNPSARRFKKIREAIAEHASRMRDNIMDEGRNGEPIMRWEYYQVQLRIAQAAYNYNGYIVTGTRHSCPIMEMQILAIGWRLLEEWCNQKDMIQGFTDQYGNFLTRKEAYIIAKAAGQIIRKDHCPGILYSECYI